jgi:hypothetical protein
MTSCVFSDNNGIKQEFNSKRNYRKYKSSWRTNHALLHEQWVTEKIRGEIRKFLESNENENKIYQNLWYIAKAVLKGTFIAMSAYI